MKTDLPLKRVTYLRPMDLLPLLGLSNAEVLGVETLELPSSASSLDTVLRLRNATGQQWLHLVEWQGWRDPLFLWRMLRYLGWLGENRDERPLLITLIYLTPEADMGDTLVHALDEHPGWSVTFPCVRLWEQDAQAALASGAPGLLALSPLMRGATADLVEQAAQTLIAQVAPPTQGELLAALGIFAEPLIDAERFVQLVTKERLMSTDLITYLFQEKTAEFEQEKTALVQEKTTLVQEKTALVQALQQTVADALVAHFPNAPLNVMQHIHNNADPVRLVALHQAVLNAPDLAAVEQLLAAE